MMHMDLWFDLAIRGEPHPEDDLLERFDLSDGSDPDPSEGGDREADPPGELF